MATDLAEKNKCDSNVILRIPIMAGRYLSSKTQVLTLSFFINDSYLGTLLHFQ
ncbi:hypothetical protein RUM43_001883, partial [Polyplax serrata]